MGNYFSNNYKKIKYPLDSAKTKGLRNAQIGAIHAIASFFTLQQNQAAITVMPTGAGKTAVLMLTPFLLSKNKVLVVTPSVMVRGQIAEDFQTLSTLCKANVFKQSMPKPTVYETSVYKRYKQDKIEMRGDRAEMSDFPLYLNTVAGGLDRRDQTIGGFSFVVKIYAVPVIEIIG